MKRAGLSGFDLRSNGRGRNSKEAQRVRIAMMILRLESGFVIHFIVTKSLKKVGGESLMARVLAAVGVGGTTASAKGI